LRPRLGNRTTARALNHRNRERKTILKNKQIRRLRNLGVPNFESVADARESQTDLLKCLTRTDIDPVQYADLSDCRTHACGRKTCSDACAFGARRRRLQEILAVYNLLKQTGGPVYEVYFRRPAWERCSGELGTISLSAVKKLNSRILNKLYNPGVVSVGVVKVLPQIDEPTWTVAVHEVIAGANKADLDQVFAGIAYVKQLKPNAVGQAIASVLRRDLDLMDGSPPKASRRAEFYQWTLDMLADARVVRYGCDVRFKKLNKKPRIFRPKAKKKRPYPHWLVRHQFGGPKWANVDPHGSTFDAKNKNKATTIRDPGPEYYDGIGDD
jgi:hypothetical protein